MDYYYGGDIPKDEWLWNPEEEEKPSGGSDAILYVVKEQQKVERQDELSLEEKKVVLEGNLGVDVMEDRCEVVGQKNPIPDVGGEDGAEDDSKDT